MGKGLRASVTKAIAKCDACESLIVPTVFVWFDAATSEIRGANGQVVGSHENGRQKVSGFLFIRVFVFTKSGDLAYNAAARLDGTFGVRHQAQKATEEATEDFPRHILAK